MGATKPTAAPRRTPSLPSAVRGGPHLAGDYSTTNVKGGGIVRLAGSEYYAAVLGRFDGQRVIVRPDPNAGVLEVLFDGRLLCHAELIRPGDDDKGAAHAHVPRSPNDGAGGAQLRLPPHAAARVALFRSRCSLRARARPWTAGRHHHEPRRNGSAREHPLGHRRRSEERDTPTTRIRAGSARRRTPDVGTAPARGPPIVLPCHGRPARGSATAPTAATHDEAGPLTPP